MMFACQKLVFVTMPVSRELHVQDNTIWASQPVKRE